MKKITGVLLLGVFMLSTLFLSGCYFWPDNRFEKMAPPPLATPEVSKYSTYVVTRSTMFSVREFSGVFAYATADNIDLKNPPSAAAFRGTANYSIAEVKANDVVSKGTVLAKMNISELEKAITDLQDKYKDILMQYELYVAQNKTDLAAVTKTQADEKKKILDSYINDRQYYTIKAPYDCMVLSLVGGTNGGKTYATAIKIADVNSLALVKNTTENPMGLNAGDEGTITFTAPGEASETKLKAKITAVPQIDAAEGSTDSRLVAVFNENVDKTKIQINAIGKFVITDGQADNILMIPKSAVLNFGTGKKFVRVLDSAGVTLGEKLVTLGTEGGLYVEVLDGLIEGDIVVLPDAPKATATPATIPAVTAKR